MRNTHVAVKICKKYDTDTISANLDQAFELLGKLSTFIKPEHTVLIKPDLYHCTEPNIAKTTNPHIVSAIAELIAQIGAKCIIADSPKGDFSQSVLDKTYIKTQMLQSSNNGHAILNTNENVSILTNPKGEYCRDIYVIDAVNDADVIINVGKFRCDPNLGIIGCSQNLFGLIPGKAKELIKSRCYTLNSYFNYLIDLYETLENKIVLNILDGIVGCEVNNDQRILNAILVGENPYAVDATALKIINQNPEENLLLTESARRNKFNFNYKTVGDSIEPLICNDFKYSSFLENIKDGSKKSFKRTYNRTQKRPIISSKLCKGCKRCVANCPMKAIEMKNSDLGEHATINYDKCINCFACLQNCPYKIIKTKTPIKYNAISKKLKKSLKG